MAPHAHQMHLAAFLIAGPVAHSHALWRHPETDVDFLHPELYQRIASILERAKFDLVFFADRLAMADTFGHGLATGVAYGDQDVLRLDPIPVLAMMASVTGAIGLGATRSTTYYQPYHVARTFATLDHLTRGRSAWNVVTSANDSEARNFGLDQHLEHDLRYDRADEFMQATFALWDSWQPDALVLDRERGVFANPDAVRYASHSGRWFRSRGPLNVPRGPQGHPVIIQAGSSGRGKAFAARWAEVIFVVQPDTPEAKAFYDDVKAELAANGRPLEACKILLAVMPFVGETTAHARERQHLHNELVDPHVGLATLSSHANYDLSRLPLDEPLQPVQVQGMQGLFSTVLGLSRSEGLTLREIGKRYGQSVLVPQLVGTGSEVADQLEALFVERACDGFVISPSHLPGAFAEFAEHVVPELQRRALFRREYAGATLRNHLGVPVSESFSSSET
ncbi:MAG TPA: LLM class flavin-dependent oxidoreductase [Chloroflexota bacterium]|jgi:FMN-dependent oxidoreductase (nitrilotriacetate monooxygenase family)